MGFSQNRSILQWGRESGVSRPRRLVFTLHTREMFLCSVGSIFNDLCKCMFSFCLLFFMEVVKLSAADTGLIILIGQIVDSLTSVISGYLDDMVKVPVLSQKLECENPGSHGNGFYGHRSSPLCQPLHSLQWKSSNLASHRLLRFLVFTV